MTTTVVKTIDAGGTGDYTTLAAWESAAPANLVTSDQIWQGQLLNASTTFTNPALTMAGSTSDATRYKELTTAAGASFRDNANVQTNALRYNTSNGSYISQTTNYGYPITQTENYCRINNLQIAATNKGFNLTSTGTGCDVNFCIFEMAFASGVDQQAGTFRNSLVVGRASSLANIAKFKNVTVVNATFVVPSDKTAATDMVSVYGYGTTSFKNVAFFGATNVAETAHGTANFTTCYTDDASPPSGCTNVAYDTSTGSGFQNITDATRDYRLKSGSGLLNVGTTDSTNAPIDIAGTARPQGASYDIGCWELVSGTVASISSVGNIASAEAFGSATVTHRAQVSPSGVTSAEVFGTPVFTHRSLLSPSGILSAEAFGNATITHRSLISLSGVASGETFGTATVTSDLVSAAIWGNSRLSIGIGLGL